MWGTQVLFPSENFLRLFEIGSNHRKRRYGSRLCAKNPRTQRGSTPSIGIEESFFVGRPSTFGSDGDFKRGHLAPSCGHSLFDCVAQRCSALLLGEDDARRSRVRTNPRSQRGKVVDQRDIGSPRLLRGFMHNATPAPDALLGGLRQVLLGTARDDRRQCGDTQFSCFLNGPLHVIELIHRENQRDGQRWIGLKFSDEIESDFCWMNSRDLRMKNMAARDYIGFHARLRTQHASHVLSLRANDCGCGFIPMFGNPAASCHGIQGNCFPSSLPSPTSVIVLQSAGTRINTEGDAL